MPHNLGHIIASGPVHSEHMQDRQPDVPQALLTQRNLARASMEGKANKSLLITRAHDAFAWKASLLQSPLHWNDTRLCLGAVARTNLSTAAGVDAVTDYLEWHSRGKRRC